MRAAGGQADAGRRGQHGQQRQDVEQVDTTGSASSPAAATSEPVIAASAPKYGSAVGRSSVVTARDQRGDIQSGIVGDAGARNMRA